MVMAPVSLTFLSVPVSSSAFAGPAKRGAASARTITARRLITVLLYIHEGEGRKLGSDPSLLWSVWMQWPGHRVRRSSHCLIGIRVRRVRRLGELVLQLRAHRGVQVQALGRDLLREPFLVQLLTFAALIDGGRRAIHDLFERRVILAQHDAVGLRLRECVL